MRLSLLLSFAAALSSAAAAAPVPAELQTPFASLHPVKTLHLGATADWVLATDDAIWTGTTGPFAVRRIDPATNEAIAAVDLPGEPCAGLAAGFGSLWIPLCGKPNQLAQVDLKTNRLIRVLPVGPAAAEGGIAAGEDSVWIVTDAKGSLTRMDPETGLARQTVVVAAGSYNPLYRDGVVWVTGHDAGVVTAVDDRSGNVLAVIPVGEGPRFLTAGGGAVWVLLQGTGEIVRIDSRTRQVVARIPAGLSGPGGDIAYGGGSVWPTFSGVPLTRINVETNALEKQWVGPGGDSLTWAFGSIWLTDYKAGNISRYSAAEVGAQ